MSENSVFHAIGSIGRVHGGTAVFAAELLSAQAALSGMNVSLGVTQREDSLPLDARVRAYWVKEQPLFNIAWLFPGRGPYAGALRSWTEEHPRTVVHLHGLWLRLGREVTAFARKACLPLVLSPHGMLEPWSLAFKAGKKRLALAAYQRREIGQAALLHATAAEELEGIRLFGARQPCAVIPIGVHLPVFMEKPDCEVKTALFLSRIHPKKGILELLRAWKRLAPKDWRLVLAGNDDGGHLAAVESEIRILGLGDQVSNEGAAFGEKKERLFREADVFLLPSYSENFGIVVTEALSYGVPVLTTTGTPWKHLPKERCGWCIGTGQEPLIRGLEEVLTTSLKQLREMGAAGRALVERDYRWERVAEQFAITYQWLLDGGQTPSWVYS